MFQDTPEGKTWHECQTCGKPTDGSKHECKPEPRIAENMIARIEDRFTALYPNLDDAEKAIVMLEIIEVFVNHYLRVKNVQKVLNSTSNDELSTLGRYFFDSLDKIHKNASTYEADKEVSSQN